LTVDVDVEENFRVTHNGCPYHRFGPSALVHNATIEKKCTRSLHTPQICQQTQVSSR
jgi:hypothetical protein